MKSKPGTELVPEEELYELFERRRPDPDAFRVGVEQRLEEQRRADEARGEDGEDNTLRAAFLKRAASFVPIDPLAGTLAGSALGKAVGTKLLPTVLALPALVIAATVGSFVAGARSLSRSIAGALPAEKSIPRSIKKDKIWGQRLLGVVFAGGLIAMLLAPLTGGQLAVDVLALMLLLSMASLVVMVRGFARAGVLSRPQVAGLGVGLLVAVFCGCFLWFSAMPVADDRSTLGVGWCAGVVLFGMVACWFAARRPLLGSLELGLGLACLVWLNPVGVTRTSPDSIRSQLVGLQPRTNDLRRWSELAALYEALRATGEEVPDLSSLADEVARAIESNAEVHPVVWTAAARMGLIDDEHWRLLASRQREAHALDRMLAGRGGINRTHYHEYEVPMLLAAREPSSEELDRLVAQVEAIWPETGDQRALGSADMCLRLLELLGRPDLVEARREAVHALLRDHWISDRGGALFTNVGGFTPNAAQFNTSFDDATLHGIELMARLGVPEDIDLWLLRGHLRWEARAGTLLFAEWHPFLKSLERAALLRLEREIGMPKRTWLEHLLAERLLIASLLIVLLCLVAIRLAPPVAPGKRRRRDAVICAA